MGLASVLATLSDTTFQAFMSFGRVISVNGLLQSSRFCILKHKMLHFKPDAGRRKLIQIRN